MTATVFNVSFDCADPYALAQFWSEVTGRPMDGGTQPGDEEIGIRLDNGSNLFFQRVPEGKFREPRTDRSAPTCTNKS